jgi:trimethylamine:corrinoid methyltransferase-like protein
MHHPGFTVQRPPILSIDQLERIEEAMLRILETIGVAVLDEGILADLHSDGFQIKGDRVLVDRKRVLAFLDAERKRNGDQFSETPRLIEPSDSEIELSVSPYPQHIHDTSTDTVVPFTTERLIDATKLVDVLSSRGVSSSPPGCPTDVPPPLQPIVQYWIAATYSRHGRHPIDPKSMETIPYVMKMAEVLGNPLRQFPV